MLTAWPPSEFDRIAPLLTSFWLSRLAKTPSLRAEETSTSTSIVHLSSAASKEIPGSVSWNTSLSWVLSVISVHPFEWLGRPRPCRGRRRDRRLGYTANAPRSSPDRGTSAGDTICRWF